MEIKGINILITGASRGIGKITAIEAARLGANIGINYHKNKMEAEKVLDVVKSYGVEGVILQGDVSKYEDVKRIVQGFVSKFNKIDVLINNAGISP